MTQQLVLIIGQYGVAIVVLNVFIDQIGLPVPAMPTLVVAGAIAATGKLSFIELLLLSGLACVVADCAWYFVGQIYGIRVLKLLCRISLEPDSCVSQTQTRFERWGIKSLVIAKFVPGLAIIAPPLAGAMRIGWPRFIALSTARALEPRWIPGALYVPLEDMGNHIKELPRDRDIILYCACPSEASAARVAKILMNHGFTRVRPLHGGLDAWVAAGHAVASAA